MRFLQAAVLILASLAPRVEAAAVRLAPVDRPLTAGTTFATAISVEGSSRALGGYLFDLAFDHGLLTLESLAPEGDHPFTDEFFKNSGIGMGGGKMAGLNSRSLSGPIGRADLAVARFRVNSSTAIFASSHLRNSNVTVSVREAVDMVDTRASTIAVTGAALAFEVVGDTLPPVTQINFNPPSALSDPQGRPVISTSELVGFSAQDFGAYVSGVAQTGYLVDQDSMTAALVTSTSPFTLAAGAHTVIWASRDAAGNVEVARSTQVFVKLNDSIAPVTQFLVNGLATGATQLVLISTDSLGFAASDEGTGVARTFYVIDAATTPAVFVSTFSLSVGTHALAFHSVDHAGNVEASRVAALTVLPPDSLPPRTTFVIGPPRFGAGPVYVSTAAALGFTAIDDQSSLGDGAGLGVARTLYAVDSGSFTLFSGTFAFPTEGLRAVSFHSVDVVGNEEAVQISSVAVDATPPASAASIGSPTFTAADGAVYVATTTPVAFAAADPALSGSTVPGSGVARVEVALDGGPFLAYSSAVFLAEGRHVLLDRAVDNVGNVSAAQALAVRSDGAPPVSSLAVGAPQFRLPNALLVSSRTPFEVAAVDPIRNDVASGVKDASFRVSDLAPGAAAFRVYAGTFTLDGADVGKVIEFFSRDNVLNAEVVRSSAVLLDSTPPEIALLSPASCGGGICRVLKGRFPVLGTARDAHFANYRLEFASGQDATTGYALISSGTLAASSGTLGTWDASALSGWLTLRLSASDLVQNVSMLALNVFIGDPGQSLVLGNHEVFDMPEGVAVGGDEKIYVADRNNDRIAVFSSTGTLLASLGGRKDDDDDDDHKESTTTVRLNKPSGVAVDAAGNIYVADTNRDRVLKLSADGQILLAIGRRDREHGDEDARLPGQFQHPAGVAVDAAANIYVADTGNRRVQVFSSTGAFNFQFNLPPVPARLDHDDDVKNDDDDAEFVQLGKPSGIAVDAAGRIYVADSKGGRALKFGAAGELLLTIPIPGDKPGSLGQPFGVAVSSSGDCLLVSDRKSSRILKFDFLGNSNLVFGSKGKIKDDDASTPSSAIIFKKPMGLALDAQGNLFVADRNNNRIQKLGLPTGQAALVVPPPKPEDEHIARGVADTEDGGKIERRDRAAVDIPAGAVALDLKITVSTPTLGAVDDSNRRRAAEDARLKTTSPPVEYGPEGTKFKGSVTLTLPYSPDLAALQNIDPKDLKVRYWNREKTQWEDLESVVDPKTRTVKAKTTHFSLYQVFSGTVSAAAFAPLAADATFTFHDAYAFPNPARGVNTTTIRIQTGLADSVEVRVYDVSGRKIHSSTNFSLNPNLDDGNGKGEQYTYDHTWDVSGVGSGVYQFVITAKKAGHSDIHKTGRVAVIK